MFHRPFFHYEHHARFFEKGDLKYVILNLLKDKPGHGYEIIRALEEQFQGFYTPSAGSVYPTLQMLEDMGYVRSSERDGKKTYTITEEGLKFLKEQKDVIDRIRETMKGWGPPHHEEFIAIMRDLRGLGHEIGRRARDLEPEKWKAIREIISRAIKDIEGVLVK
jgi:DNA-binding PadR family transcriptional regulator